MSAVSIEQTPELQLNLLASRFTDLVYDASTYFSSLSDWGWCSIWPDNLTS